MTNQILVGILAAVLGPTLVFVTWLLSRRHTEDLEDAASMHQAVETITDANVNIASIFNGMLEPMQREMKRLSKSECDQAKLIEEMRDELTILQTRSLSILRYVNILRKQLFESGMEPAPIPEDLDLHGLEFD